MCVLFSLPVLIPMLWAGSFAGAVARKHVHSRRAQRRAAGLVIFLGLATQLGSRFSDDPSRHPLHVAETELTVDAPPSTVFALLTTSELKVESRWPWFMRIGLPMPDRMTVEQSGLGGRVRFDFSQGTAFARITRWQPDRALAYAVDG